MSGKPSRLRAGQARTACRPVILFDSECGLCRGWVRFVLRFDRRKKFLFSPLQSTCARRLMQGKQTPEPLPDSIVLLQDGGLYFESEAVLRIASALGLPWSLAAGLRFVPAPLRNAVYRVVARLRRRLFPPVAGACRRLLETDRTRFLE